LANPFGQAKVLIATLPPQVREDLGLAATAPHRAAPRPDGATAQQPVALDSDRFARGAADAPGAADHLGEFYFQMKRQAVELWTVRNGHLDALRAAIEGERSHYESARQTQAIKAGKRRQSERGEHLGGRCPTAIWTSPTSRSAASSAAGSCSTRGTSSFRNHGGRARRWRRRAAWSRSPRRGPRSSPNPGPLATAQPPPPTVAHPRLGAQPRQGRRLVPRLEACYPRMGTV
jgi:hypothetical protein